MLRIEKTEALTKTMLLRMFGWKPRIGTLILPHCKVVRDIDREIELRECPGKVKAMFAFTQWRSIRSDGGMGVLRARRGKNRPLTVVKEVVVRSERAVRPSASRRAS